jgi:DNA-directed RNA polymerase specialized sigma24 family protein
VKRDGTLADVCRQYEWGPDDPDDNRVGIRDNPKLMVRLPELLGKTLGCFCPGKPGIPKELTADSGPVCHGVVLLRLLEKLEEAIESYSTTAATGPHRPVRSVQFDGSGRAVRYVSTDPRFRSPNEPAWGRSRSEDLPWKHRGAVPGRQPAAPYTTCDLGGGRTSYDHHWKGVEYMEHFKLWPQHPFYLYEENGAVAREVEPWLGETVPRAIMHTIVEPEGTLAKGFILTDEQRESLPKTTDHLKPTEYKAVRPRGKERAKKTWPRTRKPLPKPKAALIPELSPNAPDASLEAERKRWEAYWEGWNRLVGSWWDMLADEEPHVVGTALHAEIRRSYFAAREEFEQTGRGRANVALLHGALGEFTWAFIDEGFSPDAEGWKRIIKRVLDFLHDGLPEIHLRADGGRSMSSIVYAARSTKTRPSHKRAYERRDGTKLNILASHLAAATKEAEEAEDDFLGRSVRGAAARARRGVSLKQVKFEDRQERLDKVVGEGPATVGDLEPDPGTADPTRAYAKKMEREAHRELMVYINTVAMETLKKRQKEVWVALYINRDKRPHGKIAAEMGISKSAFSKTRGRALENVRGALAERGIDVRIDGWTEKWWLDGPRVPHPDTNRPMPAFHPQRMAS